MKILILDKAADIVANDRNDDYGAPEDNLETIAQLVTSYLMRRGILTEQITSDDVAMMFILAKVSRFAKVPKIDNLIDIAGYAECAAQCIGGDDE